MMDEGIFKQAYTTIATTLNRLHNKGLVNRVSEGRKFRFSPRAPLAEMCCKDTFEELKNILTEGKCQTPLLSLLVEECSKRDATLLDQLEELIKQKRRTLRKSQRLDVAH
jgi:predicted transcriptional regulator